MAYRIEIAPAAQREVRRLPTHVLQRVAARIDSLAEEPRPRGAEKLAGLDHRFRVRVGDYRILYDVLDDVLVVLVVKVGHRRDVYRRS